MAMLYSHPSLGFGLTIDQVRRALPECIIPDDASFIESPSGAFQGYATTQHPDFDPLTHRVVEAAPVDGQQVWVVEALPQADRDRLRAEWGIQKRTEIDRSVTAELDLGVTWDGDEFHVDDRFLTELMAMIMGYQAGVFTASSRQAIRTRGNTIRQLTQANLVALAGAVGEYRRSVYARAWAEKDAL